MYRGRFAPSPTGPLHFGSLVAAVASYCQARSANGTWLVRIEDIDPPREVPGAADDILRTLESYALEWDEEVTYQSQRQELYENAIQQLVNNQQAFACTCSRKDISRLSHTGVYPGTCRDRRTEPSLKSPHSFRIKVTPLQLEFADVIQGRQTYQMESEIGDFVIKRADGLYAYQLAVGLDDALQGITQVVRGSDLLESTPRQIYIQQSLGLPTPEYAHHPVVVNPDGSKLSKQNLAPAINSRNSLEDIHRALCLLGQEPSRLTDFSNPTELLGSAISSWDLGKIPKIPSIQIEDFVLSADTN